VNVCELFQNGAPRYAWGVAWQNLLCTSPTRSATHLTPAHCFFPPLSVFLRNLWPVGYSLTDWSKADKPYVRNARLLWNNGDTAQF